jgi:hypothetical protein
MIYMIYEFSHRLKKIFGKPENIPHSIGINV